jgi:hypothetical protein
MSEQSESFVGTFMGKLKEQSFTIILLVAIMYYQNSIFTQQLEEYKKSVEDREKIILDMAKEERIRLLEREKYLVQQRDKLVEDMQKELNDRISYDEKK